MNRVLGVGALLLGLGVVGYLVGVTTAFPGRAFSVTAIMLGITLVAIRRIAEVGE